MFKTNSFVRTFFAKLTLIVGLILVSLTLTSQSYVKGQDDPNIALKGAYVSSVTDGVDLLSGKLEQVIPLMNIHGRGEISQGLYLPLRNPGWDVIEANSVQTSDRVYTFYRAVASEPWAYHTSYSVRGGYGALGKIETETIFAGYYFGGEVPSATNLKITLNNGSIITFRDAVTDGQPLDARSRGCIFTGPQIPSPPQICSRGRVFHSTDGSNAIFVADADVYDVIIVDYFTGAPQSGGNYNLAGTLYLSSGTRIRIDNPGINGFNNISRITDRNGNQITLEYVTEAGCSINLLKKITDSMNREVTIDYGCPTSTGFYDELVYKGFNEAERRIRINYAPVENAMLPGQSLGVPLFPGVTTRCQMYNGGGCDPTPAGGVPGVHYATSIAVPTSVVLPNGKEYKIYYNNYLEIARIKSPTGAYLDYNYTGPLGGNADGYIPPQYGAGGGSINRRVGSVKTFDEIGQLISEKTFSNTPGESGSTNPSAPPIGYSTIDMKDVNGTVLSKSRHHYYVHGGPTTWLDGKEYKTEILDPVSQAVLGKTETTWEQRAQFQWCQGIYPSNHLYPCEPANYPESPPSVDPRIIEVKTTLETGQITKKTFSYDQFNNVIDTYEFDYGNGQAGQFLRRSHTDYVTDSNYTSYTGSYLLGLPLQSWVSSDINGSNKTTFTQYEYDNYNADNNHAALVSRNNVSGFDTTYNSGHTRRGNPTSVTSFTNAQNQTGAIFTYAQFDVLGNVVKTIDAIGVSSTVDYSDRFGSPTGEARGNWDTVAMRAHLNGKSTYAFATSATNPLGHTSYLQFDYSTGQVVDAEDINETVSTTFYNDVLDRQTQVILANNRPTLKSQKTIIFDDTSRIVTVTFDLYSFGDNLGKTESLYNSLGQTTENRSYETGGYIVRKMEYDALGRVVTTSNPHRPYLSESPNWTITEYDTLGRTTKVKTSDDSKVLTSYTGNATTVTDQAGKKRRSLVNAIGQLIRIDEANSQNTLGTVDSPTQPTFYTYNANGQMVKVTQGGQSRYFLYDSMGRLLRVRQPEQATNSSLALSDPVTGNDQWSTGSTYDANGNTLTATDAKGLVSTQTYDNLNRALTRSYSDATPTVSFTYENPNIAFSKGQVTKVSSSISTTEFTSFDAFGKILGHKQTTDGQIYTTAYSYNLSGVLVEETYPSGRVVKNTFNNDVRLTDVSSKSANQSAFHICANNFAYTSFGAVSQVRLGNGNWESMQFNARLQVTQIGLGTSQNSINLWQSNYDYGEIDTEGNVNPDQNNGNIARQTINFTGLSHAFVQTDKYDTSNRLSETTEMNGATQTWKQNFGYDRYGNRTAFSQQVIGEQSITQTPTVDPATNRFLTGQGFVYDSNGNVTQDNQNRQFVFNGDNKQIEVKDVNNNTIGTYYYDGVGQRVKKITSTETTIFVYDAVGKLVAEYALQPVVNPSINYVASDNLGSPRVITDATGNVVSRRDFKSFGEEIYSGTANRTEANGYGYGTDNVRKRFTGYEKDIETGLDFAEARYYDNRYGRFTAVDPLLASGKSSEPQSFNRYAYVMNNPIIMTDSTGLWSDREWNTVDSGLYSDWAPSIKPIAPNGSKGGPVVDAVTQFLGFNPFDGPVIERVIEDNNPMATTGWRRVQARDKVSYEWVNDPRVHDVPNDHIYVDISGRVIQLSGSDDTNRHGWGVVFANKMVDPTIQGPTPQGSITRDGVVADLKNADYHKFVDIMWDHLGSENFAKKDGPTLHVSIYAFPRGVVYRTTVHTDMYSPVNQKFKHVFGETAPNVIKSSPKILIGPLVPPFISIMRR